MFPVGTCLAGIGFAELALHLVVHGRIVSQLLVIAAAFAAGCVLTLVIPAIRQEVSALGELIRSARRMSATELVNTTN